MNFYGHKDLLGNTDELPIMKMKVWKDGKIDEVRFLFYVQFPGSILFLWNIMIMQPLSYMWNSLFTQGIRDYCKKCFQKFEK